MLALIALLACAPDAPVTCPSSTPAGGAWPQGADGWWTLDDPGVEGLDEVWPFRAHQPMAEGDEAWWCEGGGETWQRRGAAGEVRGELDAELRPQGAWTATWENTGATALVGHYAHGVPVGAWVFSDPSGKEIASGSFELGRPHGVWRVVDGQRTVEARYVYGILHGTWVETRADGTRVEGHYFDGRRNYEWDFLTADGELDHQEAWKYGTFVAGWGADEANPLPGKQLPGDKLGPQAEGICKVHATCATNAFLTVMLTGHAMSAEEALEVPVLVDFADASAPPEAYERVLLVDEYEILEVEAGIGATEATATVRFDARCVITPEGELVPVPADEIARIDLQDRDGVWKLATPLSTLYVRLDKWIERHPERTDEAMETCGGAR